MAEMMGNSEGAVEAAFAAGASKYGGGGGTRGVYLVAGKYGEATEPNMADATTDDGAGA